MKICSESAGFAEGLLCRPWTAPGSHPLEQPRHPRGPAERARFQFPWLSSLACEAEVRLAAGGIIAKLSPGLQEKFCRIRVPEPDESGAAGEATRRLQLRNEPLRRRGERGARS